MELAEKIGRKYECDRLVELCRTEPTEEHILALRKFDDLAVMGKHGGEGWLWLILNALSSHHKEGMEQYVRCIFSATEWTFRRLIYLFCEVFDIAKWDSEPTRLRQMVLAILRWKLDPKIAPHKDQVIFAVVSVLISGNISRTMKSGWYEWYLYDRSFSSFSIIIRTDNMTFDTAQLLIPYCRNEISEWSEYYTYQFLIDARDRPLMQLIVSIWLNQDVNRTMTINSQMNADDAWFLLTSFDNRIRFNPQHPRVCPHQSLSVWGDWWVYFINLAFSRNFQIIIQENLSNGAVKDIVKDITHKADINKWSNFAQSISTTLNHLPTILIETIILPYLIIPSKSILAFCPTPENF